jgi:hypothetical protein
VARAAARVAARELREAAAERDVPGSLKSENMAQSAHVQLELRWQAAIATQRRAYASPRTNFATIDWSNIDNVPL